MIRVKIPIKHTFWTYIRNIIELNKAFRTSPAAENINSVGPMRSVSKAANSPPPPFKLYPNRALLNKTTLCFPITSEKGLCTPKWLQRIVWLFLLSPPYHSLLSPSTIKKKDLIFYFLFDWAFPLSILEIRITKSKRGLSKPWMKNAE